tara:strand:- start:237 stop:920 length:684 start_codon:yes stop_codon:yes gene_type:complete
MKNKAVVLVSGGLDSATCLAIAKQKDFHVYALTFNYGQRHDYELKSAKMVVDFFNIRDHSIINIDLAQFGGSALTDQINVPKNRELSDMSNIPVTYVPARNTIFLSLALAWAEVIGSFDIFIGVNALDYSGYPDCRPDFISAFEKTANLATKAGTSGYSFKIHTPLINMTKSEIIRTGIDLNIDYSLTSSCYDPKQGGNPCGLCDACYLRLKGFKEAKLIDPLNYSK